MRRLVLTFLCASFFQTAHANCNEDAETLRLEGKIEESIALLKQCIADELGRVAETYLQLGLANDEQQDYAAAIENYTSAIEVEPGYARAYAHRGRSHGMRGNHDAALTDLARASELDASMMESHYFKGIVLEEIGRGQEAVTSYEEALSLAEGEDRLALVGYRLGKLHASLGNTELAIANLDTALENQPALTDAYFARASLHQKAGNVEAAIEDLTQVIERDDRNAEAYYQRANLYKKQRQDHLAIKDYDRALEIDPKLMKAHAGKSMTYLLPLIPVLLVIVLG